MGHEKNVIYSKLMINPFKQSASSGLYFTLTDSHLSLLVDVPESSSPLPVMFWLYGGGFIMGDASEENYLPGPLLDTKKVSNSSCIECILLSTNIVSTMACFSQISRSGLPDVYYELSGDFNFAYLILITYLTQQPTL